MTWKDLFSSYFRILPEWGALVYMDWSIHYALQKGKHNETVLDSGNVFA